jgi:hypothetical protein
MLTKLWKLRAYKLARFAFIRSGKDKDKAESIVRAEAGKLGINPILMSLLLQLAMFFIQQWLDGGVDTPPDIVDEDAMPEIEL